MDSETHALGLASVEELANYLGLQPKAVYRYVELGQIPALRLGKRLLFDIADVRAALAAAGKPEAQA